MDAFARTGYPSWSTSFASRIEERLEHASRGDAERGVILVACLHALGNEHVAARALELLGHVPGLMEERLSVRTAARLLATAGVVSRTTARVLARAAWDRVLRECAREVVADRDEHWRGIGWLAYEVRLLLRHVDDDAAERLLEAPLTVAGLRRSSEAWGLVWLARSKWVLDRLYRALTADGGIPGPESAALLLLLAAVGCGCVPRLVGERGEDWIRTAVRADPGHLRVLAWAARNRGLPDLAALLRPHVAEAERSCRARPGWEGDLVTTLALRRLEKFRNPFAW